MYYGLMIRRSVASLSLPYGGGATSGPHGAVLMRQPPGGDQRTDRCCARGRPFLASEQIENLAATGMRPLMPPDGQNSNRSLARTAKGHATTSCAALSLGRPDALSAASENTRSSRSSARSSTTGASLDSSGGASRPADRSGDSSPPPTTSSSSGKQHNPRRLLKDPGSSPQAPATTSPRGQSSTSRRRVILHRPDHQSVHHVSATPTTMSVRGSGIRSKLHLAAC